MVNLIDELINTPELISSQITIERNDFVIKEGETEKNILVNSGALRAFYVTEFEEQTLRFGYAGSLITSLSSFILGVPSELYIQALRKTTLSIIPKESFRAFVRESIDRLEQYNILLERLLVQQMDREIDILTTSPVERLKRVMKRSPQLFQEVPLKYIANYLRMTPETLSRISKS